MKMERISQNRICFRIDGFCESKMSSVNEEIIAPFESEKIKKIKRQEKLKRLIRASCCHIVFVL